ncbi:WAT1-related protein [Parasponia andersonii]|uniref:WAT1-related protein n=1 Tax=Parasponia andersonii TaxID=3476 RepID=A0A2P5AE41_PARAD|nr:WAT1-related protein [Parasponia andersonii]
MENLDLRNSTTHDIKIIGTLFSIEAASVAVLYKGPTILSSAVWPPSPQHFPSLQYPLGTSELNWGIGGLFTSFPISSVLSLVHSSVHVRGGLHLKCPLYISIIRPLSIAIAAAVGVIFPGDALHLGRYVIVSLIGSKITGEYLWRYSIPATNGSSHPLRLPSY